MFNCETVCEACGHLSELSSQDALTKLFEELPHEIKGQFVPLERCGLRTFSEMWKLVSNAAVAQPGILSGRGQSRSYLFVS